MINIPYGVPLTSQIMPTQNMPVQTSHNNFQAFQQPQTNTQQMQTNPVYPSNPQDQYKVPLYQVHQSDMFMANQYVPNVLQGRPCPPIFNPFNNVPPPVQTQPNYGPLLQNILEQIRGQVSSTAPIFILPGGCQQSTNHHQQAGTGSQVGGPQATGQPTSFNYPSSVHCPPSFYPFPIPLPVYEPFAGQTRSRESSRGCGCCHRQQESLDSKNYSLNCCCNIAEQEDHRCTATNDDTICSKRNCPASVSLQALASQLLSLQGIVSCAATRLILRKVPGSNITNTMEDTMEKAQKAITMLTKDQLLNESRNAHQVNALINLHMTTNPPANIVPLLTLIQLKVNVMKAQIESLINKKVMECQGFGYEVETSGPIDPTVLTMKTNEELRHLLSALRQKECDERVNMNFSLYHSQRVIAEARLNNVQAKIRQVEAEFDRRRCVSMPVPSLTSRVIQQFAGSTCTFGYAQTKLFEPYPPENPLESPDPFAACIRNPRRLYLKPREPGTQTTEQKDNSKAIGTSPDDPASTDTGTGEGNVNSSKEQSVGPRSSDGSCSCRDSSSEDSIEDKKKLRPKVDRAGKVTISSPAGLQDASVANLSPNALKRLCNCKISTRSVSDSLDTVDPEVEILEIPADEGEGTDLVDLDSVETKEDEEDKTVDEKVNGDVNKIPKKEEGKTIDEQDVESKQFGDKTSDRSKKQETLQDGQIPIKKEQTAADSTEKFDLKRVKIEPEADKKLETTEKKDVSFKKEAVEENPSHFSETVHLDVKPQKIKPLLRMVTKKKFKDEIPDTPKKRETLPFGQIPIKKEHAAADSMEEFDLKRVKVEPEADKNLKTTEKKNVSVKKEAVDEKPSYFSETVHIDAKPQKMKTLLRVGTKKKIKDEIPDTPKKRETLPYGQIPIKKEQTAADSMEEFDLKRVKVEPEADKKLETAKLDISIKKEALVDKPTHYHTTVHLDLSPEQLKVEQKEAAASIRAKTGLDAKTKKMKTDLYMELKQKLAPQINDTKIHEKSTVKDVAKDKVVVPPPLREEIKEAPPDEPKTFFGIKLKKTGNLAQLQSAARESEDNLKKGGTKPQDNLKKDDTKPKNNLKRDDTKPEDNLKKYDTKPEDDKWYKKSGTSDDKQQATGSEIYTDKQNTEEEQSSEVMNYLGVILKKKGVATERSKPEDGKSRRQPEDGKRENVQIVSMMTRVEYDRSYGDFDEWIDTSKGEGEKVASPQIPMNNYQIYKSQLTEHMDNKNQIHEKMTAENYRECDEKNMNGVAQFPPLKHAARRTVIDIAENIFHQKEIESGSLKSRRDRNTLYHIESETENSIVSTICSLIESQLASFGSLLSSIPNLQDIVSSLCYKPSNKACDRDLSTPQETEVNKKRILEEDNWTLVPWNSNFTSGDGRNGFSNVHEMKRSIIVDEETKNYVIIGGSISGQFRELSRNGLQGPHHTRRTLVIRSRLKNPGKLRHEPQRPFTILKRSRKSKVSEEMTLKRQLKTSEHLCHDTMDNDKNNVNRNNAMLSKNCSFLSVDRSSSEKREHEHA